jgi:hypothetical protein
VEVTNPEEVRAPLHAETPPFGSDPFATGSSLALQVGEAHRETGQRGLLLHVSVLVIADPTNLIANLRIKGGLLNLLV